VTSSFEEIGAEFQKLLLDEVNVKKLIWVREEGRRKKEEGDYKVELDTEPTDDLKKEGEARRIIRMIQKMRREAGVGLAEKVEAGLGDWPAEFEEMIKRETLAERLVRSEKPFVRK
jgi:isoleucyl-tRNA synthetase